jgi:hypothetical protein
MPFSRIAAGPASVMSGILQQTAKPASFALN